MVNKKSSWLWIWLLLIVIVTIGISFLIAFGITKFNWLSWSSGSANGWLGFWGSFLGGIIGTLSVLYVAFSQNNKQEQLIADERQILLLKYQQDEYKNVLLELAMYRNEMNLHMIKCSDILNNICNDYTEEQYNSARIESDDKSDRNLIKKDINEMHNHFNIIKVKLKLYDNDINTNLIKPTDEPAYIFAEDSLEKFRVCFNKMSSYGFLKSYDNIISEIDKLYREISGKQAKSRKDMIKKLSTH